MMVCPAPCWSRLARLSRLGNVSLASAVNRMNSASSPRRAGSAPRSPPRSFGGVGADRLAGRLRRGVDPEVGRPAGGGACLLGGARRGVRVRALLLHRCHQTVTLSGRCRPSSPERPAVINSTAWVWVTSLVRTCGHHPPQVERGDAVGDLEDVGHVVADEDDAEALLGEAPHQVEHLAGLRDAEGRGRLVEHHDLGVPEHGLGDRHGLALTAGERGDRHPHRRHRADRQRRQGAPRRLLHVGLVEQPGVAPLAAEEHVLDDVQVVAEREVLVDDLDAELAGVGRAVDRHRLAVEQHLARCRSGGCPPRT